MKKSVSVFVNGQEQRYNGRPCLVEILRGFSLANKRVAVECNGSVVARADHEVTFLRDGDRVEIIEAVGGG